MRGNSPPKKGAVSRLCITPKLASDWALWMWLQSVSKRMKHFRLEPKMSFH